MTSLSWWIWDLSPVLQLIQFPWRALTFFELAACMLLALALHAKLQKARMLMRLMVIVIIVMTAKCVVGRGMLGADPILIFRSPPMEDAVIAAGADAAEYLPSCRTADPADVVPDGSSQKIVEASLAKAGAGVLPVLYYPFLSVFAERDDSAYRLRSSDRLHQGRHSPRRRCGHREDVDARRTGGLCG